jgi:uncharacterized protein involved in exopolysaccharide biosynthesis
VSETIAPPPSSETPLERHLNDVVAERPDVPKAFLLIVDGERAGRLHLLGAQSMSIGRAPDADIRLDDPSASAHHARILVEGGTFQIEDDASRNGTAVNGTLVTRQVLRHKDAIRIGETNLVFLGSSPEGDLRNFAQQAVGGSNGYTNSGQPGQPAPRPMPLHNPSTALVTTNYGYAHTGLQNPAEGQLMYRGYAPPAEAEPSAEASLVDLIRSVFKLLAILKRNAWVLIPLPLVCALIGWTSFYWLPAGQIAEASIRLTHFTSNISALNEKNDQRQGAAVFFADPEANFARVEVVQKTLNDLGLPDDDQTLGDAAAALTIQSDPESRNVYKAAFTQPTSRALAPPVEFLTRHLENYLREEVEKSIRTLTAESEFLKNQLNSVVAELAAVEDEARAYKEKHLDSIPERATAAFASQESLVSRRQTLETESERLRQQLTNTRQQLARSSSLVTPQQSDVNPLSALLVSKRDAVAKLKAQGLTDQHPQVRAAQIEVTELEKEITNKRTKGLSKLEWETDPRYQQLQQDAERFEGELKVNQSELARLDSQIGAASGKVAMVPQVELKLTDLWRRQGSLQQLRGELFQQHRKTLVQIELETADVHGRYEIVSPPERVNTKTSKFVAQRIGIGLAAGLVLAGLLVSFLEFRRFLRKHPELSAA